MIKYQLTRESTIAFLDYSLDDIWHAIATDTAEDCDIFITIGKRELRIPICADHFATIEQAILDCLADEEEIECL